MTADALLSAIGGPVAQFLMYVAILLLGMALIREIARR